jgi:hypothetical protein
MPGFDDIGEVDNLYLPAEGVNPQPTQDTPTLWLTLRHDPDEGDEPIGVYSEYGKAQQGAHRDAQVAFLVWDVDADDWWWAVHPAGGVEYSVYEITVDQDL